MKTPKIAASASAFICLVISAGAGAQTREAVHARIAYADLNLSSTAGMETLKHRIASGIRQACGEPTANLAIAADIHRCAAEMRADSEQRVAALQQRAAEIQVAGLAR